MTAPSPTIEYQQHPIIYIEKEITVGKRLIILAESEKGDFYNPILISSSDMAEEAFGNGRLVQCYKDATVFKKDMSIFLMRIKPYGFEDAFLTLESYDFDLMYMDEVYYKNNESFINLFLEFAKTKEEQGQLIHGVMLLSSDYKYQSISSVFPSIASLTKEVGLEQEELGKYLSLVPNQFSDENAAAVYAGILIALDAQVSPVNKTIPDVKLQIEYEKEQILAMRKAGVVCFKNTFKNGVTCASSSCAVSTDGSVHKHISNFRIAQSLINQIGISLWPFIGKTNISYQIPLIEESIDLVCQAYVADQSIRDYSYYMMVQELYGTIRVEVEFVPVFSVHSMTAHTTVKVFK